MANEGHLRILKEGVGVWNAWRREDLELLPDLREADPNEADLEGANLRGAHLEGAHLEGANLRGANLSAADLEWANLSRADLNRARLSRANLRGALLDGADLPRAHLHGADLRGANLSAANLPRAHLSAADLHGANLPRAHLSEGNLSEADLNEANLNEADLEGANLREANLNEANLEWANLRGADLRWAHLSRADLSGADLSGADLDGALLLRTNLHKATLTSCRVYGISAWDVALDAETKQHDLIITPFDQPAITVDNLEVAQFVYLLLHNEKIRHVIDTITSKVVLILGRFTPERKAVLDALRKALRKRNRLPIVFDFDKPATRDTHETITTLARMARFIIADITEPKSIPQELVSIVEQLPSVAVQPILQEGGEPWGMYDHIKRYTGWVLPLVRYTTQATLLARIDDLVLAPAEAKVKEIRGELSVG